MTFLSFIYNYASATNKEVSCVAILVKQDLLTKNFSNPAHGSVTILIVTYHGTINKVGLSLQ